MIPTITSSYYGEKNSLQSQDDLGTFLLWPECLLLTFAEMILSGMFLKKKPINRWLTPSKINPLKMDFDPQGKLESAGFLLLCAFLLFRKELSAYTQLKYSWHLNSTGPTLAWKNTSDILNCCPLYSGVPWCIDEKISSRSPNPAWCTDPSGWGTCPPPPTLTPQLELVLTSSFQSMNVTWHLIVERELVSLSNCPMVHSFIARVLLRVGFFNPPRPWSFISPPCHHFTLESDKRTVNHLLESSQGTILTSWAFDLKNLNVMLERKEFPFQ